MDNRISNKLNMYRAEIAVCTENQAAWGGMDIFSQHFSELSSKVTLLEQLSYQQAQVMVGVTAAKNKEREKTAEKFEAIANVLRVHAASTGNVSLQKQMAFSHAELVNGKSERSIQLMGQVIESAALNASAFAAYNINAQQVAELTTLRDHLGDSMEATRNTIIARKLLTVQIRTLVKETDALLKNLDKLVKVLKAAHPEFYLHYRAARTVVDQKGKSNKPKAPAVPPNPDDVVPPPPAGDPGGTK